MSNNKNKYYLCYMDILMQDLDYPEFNESYTLKDLYTFGIQFLSDIPDIDNSVSFTDKLTKKSLKYNKLGELIEDFIFCIDEDDFTELLVESDEDPVTSRFELLLYDDYIVFKQNIKTKMFEMVDENTLINTHNNIFQKPSNIIESCDYSGILNFDDDFNEFISSLESKIDSTLATLSLSFDKSNYDFSSYDIYIMKKDSIIHNKLLNDQIDVDLNCDDNGFVYENTFLKLKFLIYNLILEYNIIGVAFSVPTSELFIDDKISESVFFKKYAYIIGNKDDNLSYIQMTADDVYEAYTMGSKPNKYDIFCGAEKNDIICGFDKI